MNNTTFLIHGVGIAALIGAVFTENIVFSSIIANKKYNFVEPRKPILYLEMVFAVVAAVYVAYLLFSLLKRA